MLVAGRYFARRKSRGGSDELWQPAMWRQDCTVAQIMVEGDSRMRQRQDGRVAVVEAKCEYGFALAIR
jgi:hypothetical protein